MPVHQVDKAATARRERELQEIKQQLAAGAGLAIAQWNLVELMMTFVFVSVLDRSGVPVVAGGGLWSDEPLQRRLYHTILNSIIGFEPRVDVVTACIEESDLRKDLKRLWPGIAKRLKKAYKRRHQAAHFIFDELHQDDGSILVLLAPFGKTSATLGDKRLSRADLDQMAGAFEELGHGLRWFRNAVEIQRRREKGPRGPAPELIQRIRHSLDPQITPEARTGS